MEENAPESKNKGIKAFSKSIYEKKMNILGLIPSILLILAIIQIGYQYSQTGEIIHRGVSLKGGFTVTVTTENDYDVNSLQTMISKDMKHEVSIRHLSSTGKRLGYIIESDIDPEKEGSLDIFLRSIESHLQVNKKDYSVEVIGSSLGNTFFRQASKAMIIAFIFMSIVVWLYFRTFVPSIAVILAAFSDIVITMAIINMAGIKLSTAGIAGLLMLIGYSVDTDILLTTRVIKRKEGSVIERVYGAVKTGSTMTATTLAAALAGYIFTQSEVIKQIMLIILIGLVVDFIVTWLQNVAILRRYMKNRYKEV